MTQYKRITGKVFGGNATATGNDPQIAQFGSALAGTFIGTTDPQTIQQLPAWGEGWSGAVTPETQFPPMPEMTGAMKVLSHQICGILQQGVSTWDSGTIYYTGNFCSKNGAVYVSLTDENQGNDPVSDTANWRSYGGANLDLSNLSAVGEKHFLNKTQITNCLLEVPQNIKLELNSGLLTLKKGSILIVPYGTVDRTSEFPVGARFLNDNLKVHSTQFISGKFIVWAETTKDITYYEPTPNIERNNLELYLRIDNFQLFRRASASQSGTSIPSGFNSVYYNTNTNYCKTYYTSNSTEYYSSLPLGKCSSNTNATNNITKIDSVFNGTGYIGSTVFVDKGVKGLIPNGRNTDGSLKNIEFTTDKILTTTYSATMDGYATIRFNNNQYFVNYDATTYWSYNQEENLFKGINGDSYFGCYIAKITTSNGVITEWNSKLPFRAVDYQENKKELATKLNKNQIADCLLEVPQNIKLELNNGTLTLKSGSTVIVPNGANNFEHKSSTSDLSRSTFGTQSGENIYIELVVNSSTFVPTGLTWSTNSNTIVGTTAPTSGVFYDTANNEIYNYNSSGKADRRSLPVALVKMENGIVTKIKQVFNGTGYIGDYPWVDKGVKVLIPNGRNKDGTLKNIEVTTSKVLMNFSTPFKPSVNTTHYEVRISGTSANNLGLARHTVNSNSYYDFETNLFYRPDGTQPNSVAVARVTSDPTNGITEFEKILPFCAVDYNDALLKSDKAEIINWGMPDYSSGIEPTFPFTAPSDGVLYFSLLANNASGDFYINGVFVAFYADNADGAVRDNYTFIVSKGDVVSGFGFEFARFFPLKGAK